MMNSKKGQSYLSAEIAFNQQAINIGADQSNDVILRGPEIADFLMLLVYEAGSWSLMPLDMRVPILVDGRQIAPEGCKLLGETEISVGHWTMKVRLNGVSTDFMVYENRDVLTQGEEEKSEKERKILLSLEGVPPMTVDAGSEVEYELTVTNAGPLVANMQLQVQGIPADWIQVIPPILNLNEGRRGSMLVRVNPPRNSTAAAGVYHLHFVAISPNYAGETGTTDTDLTLQPYYEFLTSGPAPRVVQLSNSHSTGGAELLIVNKSNAETPFLIQTNDDVNELSYECSGANMMGPGQAMVTLGPGESKRLGLQLRARKIPLFGIAPRSVNYTAGVTPTNQPDQQQTLMGEARIHPRINFFLLLLFLLLLLIISVVVFQPRIINFGFSDSYEERVFIPYGGSTELRWNYSIFTSTATLYTSDEDAQVLKNNTGSQTVSPKVSTSYTLQTENFVSRLTHFTHTWTVEVLVVPNSPSIEAFYPNKTIANLNTPVTLTWSVNKNAERAQSRFNELVTELGPEDFAGMQDYTLTQDILAALKAYNSSGYDTKSFFVKAIPEKIDLVRYVVWVRPSGIAVPEEGNGRKVTRWSELQAAKQPAPTVTATPPAGPQLNGADAAAVAALPTETAAAPTLLLKPAEVKPQPRFLENALDIPDILTGIEGSQGNPEAQMFGSGTDFTVSQAQPTPMAGNTGELLIRPQEPTPTAVPANPNTGEFHTGAVPVSATAVPVTSPENNDVNKDFSIKYMEIVEDSSSESGYRVISYFPGYLLQQKEEILVEWKVDGVDKVKIEGLSDKDEKSTGLAYAYPEDSANFTLMAELGSLQKSFAMPVKIAGDVSEDEGSGKNCELKANATSLENPGSVMLNWTGGGNYRVQLLSSAAAEKEQAEANTAAQKEAEAKGETYTKPTNQAMSGGIIADYLQPSGFMKMDVSKKTTFILNAYDGNGNVICSKTADINVKNSDDEKTALNFTLVDVTDSNNEALPYDETEEIYVGALGQTVNVNVKFSGWTKGKDPTGTVAVSDGTSTCSMTYPVTTCKLTLKKTGTLKLIATYSGDSNYAKATSNGLLKVIEKLNTSTAVDESSLLKHRRSDSDPAILADILSTLTFRTKSDRLIANKYGLNPLGTDDYTPSGTLTYVLGSNSCVLTLKTMELSCSSNTENNTKDPQTGDVSLDDIELPDTTAARVRVTYSGDDYFNASQSESAPFKLSSLSFSLAGFTDSEGAALLTGKDDAIQMGIIGQTVNVNVSFSDWVSGVDPTGTVLVSDGTTSCSMTYPTTTCQLTLKKTGMLAITATYSGDSNYTKSVATGSLNVIEKLSTQNLLEASGLLRYQRSATDTMMLADIQSTLTIKESSAQQIAEKYGLNPLGTDDYVPSGTLTYEIGSASCVLTLNTMDLTCSSDTDKNKLDPLTGTVSLFRIEMTDTTAARVRIKYSGDTYFKASQSENVPFSLDTLTLTIDEFTDTNDEKLILDTEENIQVGVADQKVNVNVSLSDWVSGKVPTGTIAVAAGTSSCTMTYPETSCQLTLKKAGTVDVAATYSGDSNYAQAVAQSSLKVIDKLNTQVTLTESDITRHRRSATDSTMLADIVSKLTVRSESEQQIADKYGLHPLGTDDYTPTGTLTYTIGSGSCVLTLKTMELSCSSSTEKNTKDPLTGNVSLFNIELADTAATSVQIKYSGDGYFNASQSESIPFKPYSLSLTITSPTKASYYTNSSAEIYYPLQNPEDYTDAYEHCNFNGAKSPLPDDCEKVPNQQTVSILLTLDESASEMPSGKVTITDGTVSGSCTPVCTASAHQCTCDATLSFTSDTIGIKTLTATYPGDSNYPKDSDTLEGLYIIAAPDAATLSTTPVVKPNAAGTSAAVTITDAKSGEPDGGQVMVYAFLKGDEDRNITAYCNFDYLAGEESTNSCVLEGSYQESTHYLCAYYEGYTGTKSSWRSSYVCSPNVNKEKLTLSFTTPAEGSYYANKANFYYPVNPLAYDDPFGYCNPTSGSKPDDCDLLNTTVTPQLQVKLSSSDTLADGTQLQLSNGTTYTTCSLTGSGGTYTCSWPTELSFANDTAGKKTLTATFPGNTTYGIATVEDHVYVLEPREVAKGYPTITTLSESGSKASVTVKYKENGLTKGEASGPVYVYAFKKNDTSRTVLASCSFDYEAGGTANSCQLNGTFNAAEQELCAVYLGKSAGTGYSYLPSRVCLMNGTSLKINSIDRQSNSTVAYYDLDTSFNYTLVPSGAYPTGTVTFTQGDGICTVNLTGKDSAVCEKCGDECSASLSGTSLKVSSAQFLNSGGSLVTLTKGSVQNTYDGDSNYRNASSTFDYNGGWIEELTIETPAAGSYYGTKSGYYFPTDPKNHADPFAYCNPASGERPSDCSVLLTGAEVKVALVLGGDGDELETTEIKLSDGIVTKKCTPVKGSDAKHYSCSATFDFTASGESSGQKTITVNFDGTANYPAKKETKLEYIEVLDPSGIIPTTLDITLPKVKITTQTGEQTEVSGLYANEENQITVKVAESNTPATLAEGKVMLYLYDADDPDIVMDSCVIENYPYDTICTLTPIDSSSIVTVKGLYLGNASKSWTPCGAELTEVLVKYKTSYDTTLTLNEMTGVNTDTYRLYTIKGTVDYNNGTKTEKPDAGGPIKITKGDEYCQIAFEQNSCFCSGTASENCTVSWKTVDGNAVFTITGAKLDTKAANWQKTTVTGHYKTYDAQFNDAPVTTLENIDPGLYELSLAFDVDKPVENGYADAKDSSQYYPVDPHQYTDPYGRCNPYDSETSPADCVQLKSSLPVSLTLTAPQGSPDLSGQQLKLSDGGDNDLSCSLTKVSGTNVQYSCTPADLSYKEKSTGPRTVTSEYVQSASLPYFTEASAARTLYVVNLTADAAATTTSITMPVKKSVHHLYDTVAVNAEVKSGTTTVNEGTVEVFYYDPDDSEKERLSSCSYTMPAATSCGLELLTTFGPNMMIAAEYTGSGTYLPSVGMTPIVVQDVDKVTPTLVIDSMTGTQPGDYDEPDTMGGLYDAQLKLSYTVSDVPSGAAFSGTVTLTKGSESCVLTYGQTTCNCGSSCTVAWTETTKSGTVTHTAVITNMELDANYDNRAVTTVTGVYSGDQVFFNPAKAAIENVTAAKFAAPTLSISEPAAGTYYDIRNSGQKYPKDPSGIDDPYGYCNVESHDDECQTLSDSAKVVVAIAYSSTKAPRLMDGATLNVTDGTIIRQCTLNDDRDTCTIQTTDPFPFTFTAKGDKTLNVYSEGETYYGTLQAESSPYHVVSLPDQTTVTITAPAAGSEQEAGGTAAVIVSVANKTRPTAVVASGNVTVNYYDTADPENPLSTCSYTLPGASSCSLTLVKGSTAAMALKAEYTSSDTDLLLSSTSDPVAMTVKVKPTLSIDSMTGTEPGYYEDTENESENNDGGLYDAQLTLSYPADVLPSGTAFSGKMTLTKGTESCELTYGSNECTCGTLCYVEWTTSTASGKVSYTAKVSDMEMDKAYANRSVTTVTGVYSDGTDSQNFYDSDTASKDKVFAPKFEAPAVTFTEPATYTYYDLQGSGKKYPKDPSSVTDPYGYCNGTDSAPADCVELGKTAAVTVQLVYADGVPKLKEGVILWVTDGGSRAECKINADRETCNVDAFEFKIAGMRTLKVSYDGNDDYASFSAEASPYYVVSLPSDPTSRHTTATVISSPVNGTVYTVGDQITVQAAVTDTTDTTQKVKGTVFVYDKEHNLACSFSYDSESTGSNYCNLTTAYSVTMLPLYAEFSGSTTWAPSVSEPVSVAVNEKQRVDTSTTIKLQTSTMRVGKSYTVTLDLFHVGSEYSLLKDSSTEGSSLNVYTASEEVCSISLPLATGTTKAECTITPKAAGKLKLYAVYSGSSALNASTSAVVTATASEESCVMTITSVTLPSDMKKLINDVYGITDFPSQYCYWFDTESGDSKTVTVTYTQSCSNKSVYPLDGTFTLSYYGASPSSVVPEKQTFYQEAIVDSSSTVAASGMRKISFTVPHIATYTNPILLNSGWFMVTYDGDSHYTGSSESISNVIVSSYQKSTPYQSIIATHIRKEANADSPALENTELIAGEHYYLEIALNGIVTALQPYYIQSDFCWDGWHSTNCQKYLGGSIIQYFKDPVYVPVGFQNPGVYRPESNAYMWGGTTNPIHAGFTANVHGSDTLSLGNSIDKITYIGTDCAERYSSFTPGVSTVSIGEGLRITVSPSFAAAPTGTYTEGELLGSISGTLTTYLNSKEVETIPLYFGQVIYSSGGAVKAKTGTLEDTIDMLKTTSVKLTLSFESSNLKMKSSSVEITSFNTVSPAYLYIYPEETGLSEAKAAGDGDYNWWLAHKDTRNAAHTFKLYLSRGGETEAYCKMPILNSDFSEKPTMEIQKDGTAMYDCAGAVDALGQYYYSCDDNNYGASITASGQKIRGIVKSSDFFTTPADDNGTLVTKLQTSEDMNGISFYSVSVDDDSCGEYCNWLDYNNTIKATVAFTVPASSSPTPTGTITVTAKRNNASSTEVNPSLTYDLSTCSQGSQQWFCGGQTLNVQYGGYYVLTAAYSGDANYPAQTREYDTYVYFMPHDLAYAQSLSVYEPMIVYRAILNASTCAYEESWINVGDISPSKTAYEFSSDEPIGGCDGGKIQLFLGTTMTLTNSDLAKMQDRLTAYLTVTYTGSVEKASQIAGELVDIKSVTGGDSNQYKSFMLFDFDFTNCELSLPGEYKLSLTVSDTMNEYEYLDAYVESPQYPIPTLTNVQAPKLILTGAEGTAFTRNGLEYTWSGDFNKLYGNEVTFDASILMNTVDSSSVYCTVPLSKANFPAVPNALNFNLDPSGNVGVWKESTEGNYVLSCTKNWPSTQTIRYKFTNSDNYYAFTDTDTEGYAYTCIVPNQAASLKGSAVTMSVSFESGAGE